MSRSSSVFEKKNLKTCIFAYHINLGGDHMSTRLVSGVRGTVVNHKDSSSNTNRDKIFISSLCKKQHQFPSFPCTGNRDQFTNLPPETQRPPACLSLTVCCFRFPDLKMADAFCPGLLIFKRLLQYDVDT